MTGATFETKLLKDKAKWGSDRYKVIARFLDPGTRDGDYPLNYAAALRKQLAELGGRGNIEDTKTNR